MTWLWPALAGFVASIGAMLGSLLLLSLGPRAERAAMWLLPYALGTLLGAAALVLLPEALEAAPVERTMLLFVGGIGLFIAFERVLRNRLRHEHFEHHGHRDRGGGDGHGGDGENAIPLAPATAAMILWGDALHNFADGLVLGTTWAVESDVGIAATVAIVAHELPQEIGDFAVLIGAGMPRRRAFWLNWLTGLAPVPGALLAYAFAGRIGDVAAWLLPVVAGGFLYVGLADLVPALHHRRGRAAGTIQTALAAVGVATIWLVTQALRGR